jgi:hypothetical protein
MMDASTTGVPTHEITPGYDPTIQGLLAQCEADWGDPVVNREGLVPYGIEPLDRALYGIDVLNGELIVILGPHKMRKTTFVMNVLVNIMLNERPKVKPYTVVDSLESSANPKRYRDSLLSIVATRYLLEQGHNAKNFCPACEEPVCRHMGITPDFLRYNSRTRLQQQAIHYAIETMMGWPLDIYGANPFQGDTRSIDSLRGPNSRWVRLIQEKGAKLFVDDHVQQFQGQNPQATDYEKQIMAIGAVGDVVAQWSIACLMLSQVSLTSMKEKQKGEGKLTASGGNKAAQEANVVYSTAYVPGSGRVGITIEESRKSGTFSLIQPLEDSSGAFFGTPIVGNGKFRNGDGHDNGED